MEQVRMTADFRLYTFQYIHLQSAEMNRRAKDLNIQLQGVLSQVNISEISHRVPDFVPAIWYLYHLLNFN